MHSRREVRVENEEYEKPPLHARRFLPMMGMRVAAFGDYFEILIALMRLRYTLVVVTPNQSAEFLEKIAW